jgi:hypothetical protein
MPFFRRSPESSRSLCGKYKVYTVFCGLSRRLRWDTVRYGEGRPQKCLRTAYMTAYFFDYIFSTFGSVVDQATHKERRMAMSNARPHTMMSFTPIDRDPNNPREFTCNSKKSFTGRSPYCKVLCIAKP